MSEILLQYRKVDPTTWVYLSSLLTICLFFKFNRFWSVRNLDLALLILLAPGLLMVNQSRQASGAAKPPEAAVTAEQPPVPQPEGVVQAVEAPPRDSVAYVGYLWLFGVSLIWLVRMLADPTMVRRPLLEPNLTNGGLAFLGCALFAFLMANVLTSDPTPDDLKGPQAAQNIRLRHDATGEDNQPEEYWRYGPGYYLLHLLPSIPSHPFLASDQGRPERVFSLVAKTMAIGSHLAVVVALVMIGYGHFETSRWALERPSST